jgi:hypothetical protein
MQMHYADIIAYVSQKLCVCYAQYVDDTQRAGMAAAKEAAWLEAMRQLAEKKTTKESAKKEKEAAVRAKLEAKVERDATDEKAKQDEQAAEQWHLSREETDRVRAAWSAAPPTTDCKIRASGVNW